MATVSGKLLYDGVRTADLNLTGPGLANVPIMLQNTATNDALVVLTDADGSYSFINVPDGNYRVVEVYGTPGGASPGDFSGATPLAPQIAVMPPISAAPNPPADATNLDATTPTTLLFTVAGADVPNRNIMNGPVTYTPIQNILDPSVTVLPGNLITEAGDGTFGSFPQGTLANTGADPNPYPNIGSEFNYTLPNPAAITPAFHQYTIQNTMNDATANVQQTWWRISDHTSGNEEGRMMVINGDAPGAVIFQQKVNVKPNTYYLFSSWILNLSKNSALTDPQLGVEVLGEDGSVLYSATLGALIPMNPDAPEWKQIGTVIDSQGNSALTLRFTSMGPEAFGNDYAIDDISLNEIQLNEYRPVKAVSRANAMPGDIVTYTVTLQNTGVNSLTDVAFRDLVPDGLGFVPGTVTVNGVANAAFDPNAGFIINQISGGETLTVTFDALVRAVPAVNPAVNAANVDYSYSPVTGGIPDRFNTRSNDALVNITWPTECCWPFQAARPAP